LRFEKALSRELLLEPFVHKEKLAHPNELYRLHLQLIAATLGTNADGSVRNRRRSVAQLREAPATIAPCNAIQDRLLVFQRELQVPVTEFSEPRNLTAYRNVRQSGTPHKKPVEFGRELAYGEYAPFRRRFAHRGGLAGDVGAALATGGTGSADSAGADASGESAGDGSGESAGATFGSVALLSGDGLSCGGSVGSDASGSDCDGSSTA
jgi:hypothetical protein